MATSENPAGLEKRGCDDDVAAAGRVYDVAVRAKVVVHEYGCGFQIVAAVAPKNIVAHGVLRRRGRTADIEIQAACCRPWHVGYRVLGKRIIDDIRTAAVINDFACAISNVGAIVDDQVVFKLQGCYCRSNL